MQEIVVHCGLYRKSNAESEKKWNSSLYFASDHLYLVAFLVCHGHNILRTTCIGRRVSFEFVETPELCADVAGFMADATVPARRFSFEVLKLKRTLGWSALK